MSVHDETVREDLGEGEEQATAGATAGPSRAASDPDLKSSYKRLLEEHKALNEKKTYYKTKYTSVLLERNRLTSDLNQLEAEIMSVTASGERSGTKVPVFNGEGSLDANSPTLWLTNLEQLAKANKWTDAQQLSAGLLSLQGLAGLWRESESRVNPDCFASLEQFKKSFLTRFQPTQSAVEAVKIISSLKQKSEENVRAFYDRVSNAVFLSSQEALEDFQTEWGDPNVEPTRGYNAARTHFVRVHFVSGLKPSIRTVVEAKFSTLTTKEKLINAAIEAEVACSSESRRVMELEAEIAALRLATGGGPGRSFSGPPRFQSAGRGRGGSNPGGNPGHYSTGGAGGYGSSSSSSSTGGLTHKMKVALRENWSYCQKCGQWGKHRANECKLSQSRISTLQAMDPARPPPGGPRDPVFDGVLQQAHAIQQQQSSKN